jgi:Tfp pilus assembly ATPase PilU
METPLGPAKDNLQIGRNFRRTCEVDITRLLVACMLQDATREYDENHESNYCYDDSHAAFWRLSAEMTDWMTWAVLS